MDGSPSGLRARLLRLPIPAPNLDRILERMDAKSPNVGPLHLAGPNAKPRQSFKSHLPMAETSLSRLRLGQIPTMMRVQGRLLLHMLSSGRRFYRERFQPVSDTADPAFFVELEKLARDAGALDIGFVTDIPADQIFRDKGIPHRNAVVFTVEMDRDEITKAPSFETFAPHGGTRLRISAVYTNITNLPVRPTNPHTWIPDFCAKCRRCIRSCPPGAIYDEPRDAEWVGKSCIDYGACLDYFSREWGCAVCVAVCPFSNAGYDKVKLRFDRAQGRSLPVVAG